MSGGVLDVSLTLGPRATQNDMASLRLAFFRIFVPNRDEPDLTIASFTSRSSQRHDTASPCNQIKPLFNPLARHLMKTSLMNAVGRTAAGTFLLIGLAGCMTLNGSAKPNALSPDRIAGIVANPDRSAADRVNDKRRKPEQMLAFIGIRPDMVALDISAGGGYTTELLARAIGPGGVVYGQSPPRDSAAATPAPAAPEGNSNPVAQAGATAPASSTSPAPAPRRTSPEALAEREKRLQAGAVPAARIVPVIQNFEDPAPADRKSQGLDLVTLMFNYHDLGFMRVDRARMNRAVFDALKSGASYVIADHAGRPGTGISESGTLHRIEQAFLVSEVEAAGFKLLAEAAFLRNPADPRDRNTPEPAQPKDEFVLKFVRP